MQLTFQVVLATDGVTSFAILIYEDPEQILRVISDSQRLAMIGFSSGDLRSTILSRNRFTLQNSHAFRIDGKHKLATKANKLFAEG